VLPNAAQKAVDPAQAQAMYNKAADDLNRFEQQVSLKIMLSQ
jgi:hypothetical protein